MQKIIILYDHKYVPFSEKRSNIHLGERNSLVKCLSIETNAFSSFFEHGLNFGGVRAICFGTHLAQVVLAIDETYPFS